MNDMENAFAEWTNFYEKLADAVLVYKNDRKRLLSKIDKIYENSGMENKFKKGDKLLEDVCPFTVFGVFNKGIKDSNRIILLNQFAIEFGVSEKIPTSFAGIPVLNNMKAWFFTLSKDQGEDDIDNLWELFNAAIKYADGDNNFKEEFIIYYNRVLKQKNVKWNITMGLYWIRPHKYLTFDECTRNYCKNNDIFPPITKTIGCLKNPMEGEMYLNTIEQLENQFVQNPDNKINSFPTLSYAAWMESSDDTYFPTLKEYNSGISKEDWKELISKSVIFTAEVRHIMGLFLNENGEATCAALSEKYGKEPNYYNKICTSLAALVQRATDCPMYDKKDCKYWPILFLGRAIKENGNQRFSWKLRLELKEALEECNLIDNEGVQNNDMRQYWWLNANPNVWSFSKLNVGQMQSYTLYNDNNNKRRIFQNFLDAKKGDLVIGYESTPTKQIVALCEIEQENDGECLYFRKLESLISPIDYSTLKNIDELKNMEFFTNANGSLFKMTNDEFDIVMDLIREENPLLKDEQIKQYTYENFLEDVYMSLDEYNTLKALLERKKNIIMQGAPGVGKTFAAKRLAYSIMERRDDSRVEMVQFHQNYSYEDFIMGYRPNEEGFKLEYGIFYNFCKKAENNPDKSYFFIIDEINRGNLSKIFGELLMLIENDKREEKMTLAYSGINFSVPENIYIIGMMNTADRSLAMIDYALRRRFSFYKINPAFESKGFKKYQSSLNDIKLDKLIDAVKELNNVILNDAALGEGFVIGHSYFCNGEECTDEWLNEIIEYDLIPILEEYWFDDNSKAKLWANKLRGVLND